MIMNNPYTNIPLTIKNRISHKVTLSLMLILCIGLNSLTFANTQTTTLFGNTEEPEFLSVHEAFKPSIELRGNTLFIHWDITEEYYLYRKRFSFKSSNPSVILGEPEFSRTGKIKEDGTFGTVEVFYQYIDINLPILQGHGEFEFIMRFQGCAEAGLCYPPTTFKQSFNLPNTLSNPNTLPNIVTTQTNSDEPSQTETKINSTIDSTDANSIAYFLSQSGFFTTVTLCFVLGIGLTFTPCVLPMVPILSGIIAGQQQPLTAMKGFTLSLAYVLGMALTFAIAGLIVSLTGARIQIYLQNPIILSLFAFVFVLLALSMFGFFEIQLPAFLRDRLNTLHQKQSGGHTVGVFIMGILSALVVSPCVTAPLAGILLYIASEGSALMGTFALFALGLGMGAPLIVIGTTGANVLPKAGSWMDAVKALFGILLLAVGAWLIRSVLPGQIMMLIWAALLIIPSLYLGAFKQTNTGPTTFFKGIGLMMFIYGTLLIIGAATGQKNPLHPLDLPQLSTTQVTHTGLEFTRVTSLESLKEKLAQAKKNQRPAMVDYYADWCIACIEMEEGAFKDTQVKAFLSQFDLIQVDLTDNEQTDALLDEFELIGPPSILFFDKSGQFLSSASVMGEMSAQRFLEHLKTKVKTENKI